MMVHGRQGEVIHGSPIRSLPPFGAADIVARAICRLMRTVIE